VTIVSVVFGLLGVVALTAATESNDSLADGSEHPPPRGADGTISPRTGVIEAKPLPPEAVAPGREEIRAIAAAYPDRVEEVAFTDGEWAVRIDGRWFYWADARLLTEDLRPRKDEFTPLRFYRYYRGPLRIREVPPAFEERLRSILEERRSDPPVRHPGFQDALYGFSSLAEAEATMVDVEFLGHGTRVHPIAVEALARVEADVREAAEIDPEVAAFVRGLDTVEAFHWRNIAGTRARSFHSYGVAVDLIPRSYGGDFGYWLWAAQAGIEEWWALGEDDRYSMPQPVIDAFERHGFVWGGKWLFFDPIHFEYRPEVFILSEGE
jgi:hypothetical protein